MVQWAALYAVAELNRAAPQRDSCRSACARAGRKARHAIILCSVATSCRPSCTLQSTNTMTTQRQDSMKRFQESLGKAQAYPQNLPDLETRSKALAKQLDLRSKDLFCRDNRAVVHFTELNKFDCAKAERGMISILCKCAGLILKHRLQDMRSTGYVLSTVWTTTSDSRCPKIGQIHVKDSCQ